ncbi:hypothetical protein HOY80DRAFT_982956, partial [Tuber brumale]
VSCIYMSCSFANIFFVYLPRRIPYHLFFTMLHHFFHLTPSNILLNISPKLLLFQIVLILSCFFSSFLSLIVRH